MRMTTLLLLLLAFWMGLRIGQTLATGQVTDSEETVSESINGGN